MKPERLFLAAAAAFAAATAADFGYALYSGSLSASTASAIVAVFAIGSVRQFLRERVKMQLEVAKAEAERAARDRAAGRRFESRSFFEESAGEAESEEERIARRMRESLAFQRRWGSPGLGLLSVAVAAAAGRIIVPRLLEAAGVSSSDFPPPAEPMIGMVAMLAQAFPALLLAKTCLFELRGSGSSKAAGSGGGEATCGMEACAGGTARYPLAAAATIGHAATCWMWVSLASAASLMLARQGWPSVEIYVAAIQAALLLLLGVEELVRFFWSRFGPGIADLGPDPDPAPWRSFLLHVLFARVNPLEALAEGLDREFGFKISESWPAMAMRSYAAPLAAGGIVALWALSALVAVGPGEEAVVERLGRPLDRPPLGPGIHLIAPWPVDKVFIEETGKVREIGVGFRKDIGAPAILWTMKHFADECMLLVGGGDELISVTVSIQYRIKDLRAWKYSHARPEDVLADAAHRELTRLTAIRTAGELLTTAHRDLGPEMRRRLQKTADDMGIGAEIVFAGIASIHPVIDDSPDAPDVAAAYQEVVSAREEKESEGRRGALYREIAIPEAAARTARIEGEAQGAAALRLGKAEGEAKRFLARMGGFRINPSLYRTTARLEALEDALRDPRKILLDGRSGACGDFWIDARDPGSGWPRSGIPPAAVMPSSAAPGVQKRGAPEADASKSGAHGVSGTRGTPGDETSAPAGGGGTHGGSDPRAGGAPAPRR